MKRQELREKMAGELGKFAEANGLKTVKTQALLDSEAALDHLIDEYVAGVIGEDLETIDGGDSIEHDNTIRCINDEKAEQRRRAGIGGES